MPVFRMSQGFETLPGRVKGDGGKEPVGGETDSWPEAKAFLKKPFQFLRVLVPVIFKKQLKL